MQAPRGLNQNCLQIRSDAVFSDGGGGVGGSDGGGGFNIFQVKLENDKQLFHVKRRNLAILLESRI